MITTTLPSATVNKEAKPEAETGTLKVEYVDKQNDVASPDETKPGDTAAPLKTEEETVPPPPKNNAEKDDEERWNELIEKYGLKNKNNGQENG